MDWAETAEALAAQGLVLFGGFHPRPDDRVPSLSEGRPAGTLLMVGNAGSSLWPTFSAAPEAGDVQPNPLDRWSKRILGALAAASGGRAIFPSDGPPYPPFVAWAKRAAAVAESPLGMLIHPDYGLWHAYRGALALPQRLDLPAPDRRPRPCDSCAEKPCLSSCPVEAFGAGGYDVPRCVAHISTAAGADCMALGCRARRACPVGRDFVYDGPQAAFHMAAFLAPLKAKGVS